MFFAAKRVAWINADDSNNVVGIAFEDGERLTAINLFCSEYIPL